MWALYKRKVIADRLISCSDVPSPILAPPLQAPPSSSLVQVYTWGCNDEGALGRKTSEGEEYLPGLVDKLDTIRVVQVSAGDSHTAALASDGQVYCWGVFRVSEN